MRTFLAGVLNAIVTEEDRFVVDCDRENAEATWGEALCWSCPVDRRRKEASAVEESLMFLLGSFLLIVSTFRGVW